MQPQNQLCQFGDQVSGKNPKYTDSTGSIIYKKISSDELAFYEMMHSLTIDDPSNALNKYLPKYKGKISINVNSVSKAHTDSPQKKKWIDHIHSREQNIEGVHEFTMLENLLKHQAHPCVMDVKLGVRKKKKKSDKKYESSTTNSHHFRINGMNCYFPSSEEDIFVSKYYGQKITSSEISTYLSLFFYDGKSINVELLGKVIHEIKELVLCLKSFTKGQLSSSSLFVCYDGKNPSRYEVKLIDFDKYSQSGPSEPDNNIIEGLLYLLQYLIGIREGPDVEEQILKRRDLKVFEEYEIVPEHKVSQFSEPRAQRE